MRYPFELDWTEFCFFSANIVHVFGKEELSELHSLYLGTKSALKVQQFDKDFYNQIPEALNLSQLDNCPSLIISFHYGNYWCLPLQLLHQRFKVAILVSSDLIEKQKKLYLKNLDKHLHDNLVFIDAERPSVYFDIKKMILKSYHILCYIDGGVGVRPMSSFNKKSFFDLAFGENVLSVRKGIFEIAYLLRLTVYYYHMPSANEQKPESLVCFQSQNTLSRSDYVTRIITKVYSLLYESICRNPTLWEGWLFMHHSVDTMLLKNDGEGLYLPFCIENRYYIMNICNYESREISNESFEFIRHKIGYQLGIC